MDNSEETNQPTTFITLTLDIGDKEFKDLEELMEWHAQEQAFFSWMEAGSKKDGASADAWNETKNWLHSINQFIQQQTLSKGNEQGLIQARTKLENTLNKLLNKGLLLTSQNPISIFGKNLAARESEVVACYAIAYLLNISINQNKLEALKGAYYAFQYQQGSTDTVQSIADSLKVLSEEWNRKFQNEHLDLRSQNEGLIKETEKLKNQYIKLKEEINTQKEEQEESLQDLFDKSENTLSDIAHTYDEKLALQSSVQYWTDKRVFHSKVMWRIGTATLLLAIATGGGFVFAAHKLLQVTLENIELWRLGVILAISTFGIWLTRLSAKIFVSNLHLRADADERVTMIQTYLALLREGSGPKDEERQLILQTLFRPSTTGFIKDDGPGSFQEIVQNTITRNGR